jgi:colanic acid/amylovoran biosynthesis glycosyltransferase
MEKDSEFGGIENRLSANVTGKPAHLKAKGRIGLVLSMVPSYSETFFRNKIHLLEKAGFEVVLFTNGGRDTQGTIRRIVRGYDTQRPAFRKVIPFLIACFRIITNAPAAIRLYRLNRKDGFSGMTNAASLLMSSHVIGHRIDWLHFGFSSNAIMLENLARVLGARMAVSIRGYDIGIVPLKNPGCYRLLWQRIDRLHYISEDLYRLALADGLAPEVPAVKIEPAVDVAVRERIPLKAGDIPSKPTFLTVGRLHWKKGYPLMLYALSKLKAEGLDFTYRIVGEGEDREQITYLVHTLGLSTQVELMGRRSHPETLKLMGECDVYLQYSIQEGFCNSVLEAQLLGRLCIVSDAEGLSENVLHGRTGWVVQRNEAALLKETIREVISKTGEERDRIRQTASERIRREFSLEVQQRRFIGFYGDEGFDIGAA